MYTNVPYCLLCNVLNSYIMKITSKFIKSVLTINVQTKYNFINKCLYFLISSDQFLLAYWRTVAFFCVLWICHFTEWTIFLVPRKNFNRFFWFFFQLDNHIFANNNLSFFPVAVFFPLFSCYDLELLVITSGYPFFDPLFLKMQR